MSDPVGDTTGEGTGQVLEGNEQLGGPIRLGPLMRYVDTDVATVWVETEEPGLVEVVTEHGRWGARTFGVRGHHYALVDVTGLAPGDHTPYRVEVDGEEAWPPPGGSLDGDDRLPPPMIVTLDQDKPLRMLFGSCRTSVTHDEVGNRTHGVDALRAYALRMSGLTAAGPDDPDGEASPPWPDLMVFLGDQVYADETTAEMQEFIESRRDIEQAPWKELADFEEYAHLYRLAWSDPVNRWLLSTVPSAMIFDDHDIRDDWNTSQAWKEQMETTDWWHGRVVAGLASYWVYQHLGNLSPDERSQDPVWARVLQHQVAGHEHEIDVSEPLEELADLADQQPESYRWSYSRQFGTQARLVVVDSRAARVLDPEARSILDQRELKWLDEQMRGDVDHLLVGTSLPFLLGTGLHYVEAFSEALAGGAWGRQPARLGEWLRQTVDLEHWAAFQNGFRDVAAMALEVAAGRRGEAPRTVTFLSGDVHHSYVAEAWPREPTPAGPRPSRIIQAVCSPIRNPLPRRMRFATAALSYGVAGPIGHVVARSAKVAEAPLTWKNLRGPWFDNNIASLEVTDDGLRMWWARGKVDGGDHARPVLTAVADVDLRTRA